MCLLKKEVNQILLLVVLTLTIQEDGPDGRTFTLKAETLEDLNEWKTALENALAQAPSAALVMGQSGIFRTNVPDSIEASFEQWRDRRPGKSLVVGRPILLALEDIDGSPSFLEKALRFIEQYGIKVEGILRQSADVEEVERRVQEYEQGKNEFSADEDAHVIGDCIKHVLRELPSSPVPASCCTALVEAYRTDRRSRVDAMRTAISGSFPEPNLRLLQRILKMMRIVASHKVENRMSLSALSACMAPLLLRALLAGDCEVEDDFIMGGDGSFQLLQAAAAANHAQAIVIILLEEYERIFNEDLSLDGSLSSELYTDSEDGDFEDEESTDDDILEDDGYHKADIDLEADIDDDSNHSSSEKLGESGSEVGSYLSVDKDSNDHNKDHTSPDDKARSLPPVPALNAANTPLLKDDIEKPLPTASAPVIRHDDLLNVEKNNSGSVVALTSESHLAAGGNLKTTSTMHKSVSHILPSTVAKFNEESREPLTISRKPTVWGRTAARKNLSMESIDYSSEEEVAIQKLENTKTDLQNKMTKEVKGNSILQASLEKRKEELRERRLALEQDVEKLREQLQKERDLRESLESGLMNIRPGQLPITASADSKTRADLEEIALAEADIINLKHKISDLRGQLSHQMKLGYASLCESCSQQLYRRHQLDGAGEQTEIDSTAIVDQIDNLSKNEYTSSGRGSENVQAQRSDLHPKDELPQNILLKPTSQNDNLSSGISNSSSLKKVAVGTNDLLKNSSTKDANVSSRADPEDSSIMQPPWKQHLNTTKNNSLSKGSNFASFSEEPTITHKGASKKIASKFDPHTDSYYEKNSAIVVNTQYPRNQMEDSLPMKEETVAETLRSSSSLVLNDDQSIAESLTIRRNIPSTKSFSSAQNVKVAADSSALPNRKDLPKQQRNTTNLNSLKSGKATIVGSGSSKKHYLRGEETASVTSSALTKLTSRLAFLKERRVQLVNELQNLEANRTPDPEGPLPGTSSR